MLVEVRKAIDMDTIIVTIIMALAGAIGIIAVYAMITDANIYEWSIKGMLGGYLLISTLLWGYFIIQEIRKS